MPPRKSRRQENIRKNQGDKSNAAYAERMALMNHPESLADAAIEKGDFADATDRLILAIDDKDIAGFDQGRDTGRLKMKLATIDMAELRYYALQRITPPEGLLDRCGDVHDLLASLLTEMREELRDETLSPHRRGILRGDASEAMVLLLGARDFNRTGRFIVTPSSRMDNQAGGQSQGRLYSEDMRATFLNRSSRTSRSVERSLQVKTRLDPRHSSYSGFISVVYVSALEGFEDLRRSPDVRADDSLAAAALRETNGIASDEDTARLDDACDRLYDIANTGVSF